MSKQHSDKIYLGKSGKIYGPYSQREVETLVSQGAAFTWIWDHSGSAWQPIEAAPASAPDFGSSYEQISIHSAP